MAVDEYPTEPCRSCNAPVIWTETDRGKAMPVDAEPSTDGNLALRRDHAGKIWSRVVPQHLAFGRTDLRLSHFVRCPQAKQWRQGGRHA